MAPQGSPQVTVHGACGMTISVPINGVAVNFTCTPSSKPSPPILDPEPPGGGHTAGKPSVLGPAGDVLEPIESGGGHTALVRVITPSVDPNLFARSDAIDSGAEPFVIPIPAGETIDMSRWRDELLSAKDQGRPVTFEISTGDDNG
jgi:hypothetical protein